MISAAHPDKPDVIPSKTGITSMRAPPDPFSATC
jgi:hypothetical protein